MYKVSGNKVSEMRVSNIYLKTTLKDSFLFLGGEYLSKLLFDNLEVFNVNDCKKCGRDEVVINRNAFTKTKVIYEQRLFSLLTILKKYYVDEDTELPTKKIITEFLNDEACHLCSKCKH